MRTQLISIILSLFALSSFSQDYPFARNFKKGIVLLKDSTQMAGELKWFPNQHIKLKFRETDKTTTEKYSPEDIAGFIVDTLKFISLHNFEVYAEDYA